MDHIVSARRAASEGTSPKDLELVAEWHDGRAHQAEHPGKNRRPDKIAAARHRRIAADVRAVAAELAGAVARDEAA